MGHPPFHRGPIPYITLWIHLRESLEKSLRNQGGLYLPPDLGQASHPPSWRTDGLNSRTEAEKPPISCKTSKHAGPSYRQKGFSWKPLWSIFGIHQDFQPFTTVTKRDVSWVYTLEENYSLAMSFWGTLPPQMEDGSKQGSLSTIRYTRLKPKAEETFTTLEKGKKTCKLVSRTEGWSEGKKIEQTKIGDFFTRTFRLLHVFILSNIAGVPIDCYFSSLFVSVQLDMLQTDPTLPCINSAISPWE